jgi:hypothetical protein
MNAPGAAPPTERREPIHHASTFGYDAPPTCGRREQPKPAAADWRFVTCPACLAVELTSVHLTRMRDSGVVESWPFYCGSRRLGAEGTTDVDAVTCPACRARHARRYLRATATLKGARG